MHRGGGPTHSRARGAASDARVRSLRSRTQCACRPDPIARALPGGHRGSDSSRCVLGQAAEATALGSGSGCGAGTSHDSAEARQADRARRDSWASSTVPGMTAPADPKRSREGCPADVGRAMRVAARSCEHCPASRSTDQLKSTGSATPRAARSAPRTNPAHPHPRAQSDAHRRSLDPPARAAR